MNKDVLISGIITTCKRLPEYVERAVISILNQTYKNIEVIVVDDSPSDYEYRAEVARMCSKYGNKVKYIQHAKNMGACEARNTGLKTAKGEIIGYLDDDDAWRPNKVEKMIGLFDSDDVGIVYCKSEAINSSTGERFVMETEKEEGMVYDKLIYDNFIGSTSFPLLRKEAVISVDGFDNQMQASQDFDLWLRISLSYKVRFVDEVLVDYYIHEGEQIGKTTSKRIQGYSRLIEKNIDYLKKNKKCFWYRERTLVYEYCDALLFMNACHTWSVCVSIMPGMVLENAKLCLVIVKSFLFKGK